MGRLAVIASALVIAVCAASHAAAEDRVASVAQSPFAAESDNGGGDATLIALIHALDKATNSSTKIILRPFARSLKDTAAGLADFHIPFIQDDGLPAPEGLLYVTEVDFGQAQFVIYSRKQAPLDARTVAGAKNIEIEPGHEAFFPFPVTATYCVNCSLEKILLGRTDALIVASDVVDPLLSKPEYKGIHRALFKIYPVRALVPANGDTTATRRYLIDGATRLKKTGELWKITGHRTGYSDWQP